MSFTIIGARFSKARARTRSESSRSRIARRRDESSCFGDLNYRGQSTMWPNWAILLRIAISFAARPAWNIWASCRPALGQFFSGRPRRRPAASASRRLTGLGWLAGWRMRSVSGLAGRPAGPNRQHTHTYTQKGSATGRRPIVPRFSRRLQVASYTTTHKQSLLRAQSLFLCLSARGRPFLGMTTGNVRR